MKIYEKEFFETIIRELPKIRKALERIASQKQIKDKEEIRSECCGAKISEGTDLCSDCNEHTGQDNN